VTGVDWRGFYLVSNPAQVTGDYVMHTFYVYSTGRRYEFKRLGFANSFETTLIRLGMKYLREEVYFEKR